MTDPIAKATAGAPPKKDAVDLAREPVLLKTVAVKDPVPFNGPSDQTLICAWGAIELDIKRRVIVATPKDTKRDAVEIPLENVKFYVRLTEAHKAAQAPAPKPAPRPAPPPSRGDTVKFVKGPDGKPMEQLPDGTLRPASMT